MNDLYAIVGIANLIGVLEQDGAHGSYSNLASVALEQRNLVMAFESLDMLAQRRRRNAKLCSGLSEVKGVCQLNELTERLELHDVPQ